MNLLRQVLILTNISVTKDIFKFCSNFGMNLLMYRRLHLPFLPGQASSVLLTSLMVKITVLQEVFADKTIYL